jgi:hypothetical protein
MDSPHDLAEAFNRLDALLAAARGCRARYGAATGHWQGARHHRGDNVSQVADQWNDRALGAEVVAPIPPQIGAELVDVGRC